MPMPRSVAAIIIAMVACPTSYWSVTLRRYLAVPE